MTADELDALAMRVEGLAGACLETDARIWCAIHGKKYQGHFAPYGVSDGREIGVEYTEPPKRTRMVTGGRLGPNAQPVTASLHAAMALGEPFLLVAMSDIAADGLSGVCLCSDTRTSPPTEHWGICQQSSVGKPRSEVLARCYTAAALRARAAQMRQEAGG